MSLLGKKKNTAGVEAYPSGQTHSLWTDITGYKRVTSVFSAQVNQLCLMKKIIVIRRCLNSMSLLKKKNTVGIEAYPSGRTHSLWTDITSPLIQTNDL
ncbi:27781_t:CDS:2, partial [Dentiscutata erythropus]